MKLAEDTGKVKILPEYHCAQVEAKDDQITISWNLTSDYDYEDFPKEIARCLEHAQTADVDGGHHLPTFDGFKRSGMIVSIELTTLPIQLRKVIGNRYEM